MQQLCKIVHYMLCEYGEGGQGRHCIPNRDRIEHNLYDTTGYIYSIISLKSMKTLIETPFYKLPSYLVMPTYK